MSAMKRIREGNSRREKAIDALREKARRLQEENAGLKATIETQKWSEDVLQNLETTAAHTKDVVKKLVLLAKDRSRFSKEHHLRDAVLAPASAAERDHLLLVAFLHDVHKLLDGRDHASRGADVTANPETIDLIRFHDVLGVANTGEASPLFLADLVSAVKKHRPPTDFLRRLVVLTTVDVAAAGFLTQERLAHYTHLVGLVQDAGAGKGTKLSSIAIRETGERIRWLLESNDRIAVENTSLIDEALARHPNTNALRKDLSLVRFHYGAWALEPCFWSWSGRSHPTPLDEQKKDKLKLDGTHAPLLDRFLGRLWRILRDEDSPLITKTITKIGGRDLVIYNMEPLSVKFGDTAAFNEWCAAAPGK